MNNYIVYINSSFVIQAENIYEAEDIAKRMCKPIGGVYKPKIIVRETGLSQEDIDEIQEETGSLEDKLGFLDTPHVRKVK